VEQKEGCSGLEEFAYKEKFYILSKVSVIIVVHMNRKLPS